MRSLVLAPPHTFSHSRLHRDKSQPPTSADTWSAQSSLPVREHHTVIIRSASITWMTAVVWRSDLRACKPRSSETSAARLPLQTRGRRAHASTNLSSPSLASTSHSPLLLSQLLDGSRISHLPHGSILHSSSSASLSFAPPSPRERERERDGEALQTCQTSVAGRVRAHTHTPVTSSAPSPSLCHVC